MIDKRNGLESMSTADVGAFASTGSPNATIHPGGDGLAIPPATAEPPTGAIGCSPIPDESSSVRGGNPHLDDIRLQLIGHLRMLADGLEAEGGQVLGFGPLMINSAQPHRRNGYGYIFLANGSKFCVDMWRLPT